MLKRSNRPESTELVKKFRFPSNSSKATAGTVLGYADGAKYLGFLLINSSE